MTTFASTLPESRPIAVATDLSIIIVNWNGGDLICECLRSVARARRGLRLQVIVMDNDSRDGSREAAQREFPEFDIVNTGANLGFGKANNLARPRVISDLVLFLNPDTVLQENSLVPMVEFMRTHPDVGGLGCKMRAAGGGVHELGLQYFPSPLTEFLKTSFFTASAAHHFRRWLPWLDPNQSSYVIKLYGGCLLCPCSVLDAVGWFDERYFMYAEDADLCHAILNLGKKLYYLAEAEVVHVAGGTSDKAPSGFSLLMQCESIGKYIAKHNGCFAFWIYRFVLLTAAVFRITVTTALRLASFLLPVLGRNVHFPSATAKCRILISWALGVKKASIPA